MSDISMMKLTIFIIVSSVLFQCLLAQSDTCLTPEKLPGQCIFLRSCSVLLALFQKKILNQEDRQYLSSSQCGFQGNKPLVCCKVENNIPLPLFNPQFNSQPTNRQYQLPSQSTNSQYQAPSLTTGLLPKPGVCGFDASDRIFGGERTKIDEFPWMALLQYSKPRNRKGFHCGGVLINNRYVLTASHCVNGKDLPPTWQLTHVRLGEWDISSVEDCDDSFVNEIVCSPAPVDILIEQLIPHESYNVKIANQHHDIALIRLQQTVNFNEFIAPICLPLSSDVRNNNFVGQSLTVAGWGKTETENVSKFKLKVNVDGVTNEKCQQKYATQQRQIASSQFCAGGKRGKDSCLGDSGSPIQVQNERNNPPYWYLAGVVSYGPAQCGQEGWPGVYTRVGSYIGWIESKLKP